MKFLLFFLCISLLQLPANAKNETQSTKEISSGEFFAVSIAYKKALPHLKKMRGVSFEKNADFEFNVTEEGDVYKIFILSTKKETRGGDIEYWINKKNFNVTYSKYWK